MRKIKINSLYKHFKGHIYKVIAKGHIYKVIAIGKNSEDLTDMVVYENIETHEIWIRPYDMFNSLVDQNKYPNVKQKYRFEEIKEPEN